MMSGLTPEQVEHKLDLIVQLLQKLADNNPIAKRTLEKIRGKGLFEQFEIIGRELPLLTGITYEMLQDPAHLKGIMKDMDLKNKNLN